MFQKQPLKLSVITKTLSKLTALCSFFLLFSCLNSLNKDIILQNALEHCLSIVGNRITWLFGWRSRYNQLQFFIRPFHYHFLCYQRSQTATSQQGTYYLLHIIYVVIIFTFFCYFSFAFFMRITVKE